MRTFIVTFASGRTIELDALSAAHVRRGVAEWTNESFTIRVKE